MTGFEASALALMLSHHSVGFLGWGSFNSVRSEQVQTISVARSAKALYSDSVLDLDTTFYFLEDQETSVSPRKTH
ncbi:hypothetical protein Lalb_Chr05g0228871 [Lupinus albus]|uniref:Uncharacterized protein n=1 Tax=Lupinus albus TaxID=3870 RepID=A0A6A4QLB1_LUPAL|nr:hypothetical protein Lalb_Chr05g0228871 [Lupinus albus]